MKYRSGEQSAITVSQGQTYKKIGVSKYKLRSTWTCWKFISVLVTRNSRPASLFRHINANDDLKF
jgi:hypothetical protein